MKSEIHESSDRGPMYPVEGTQPCGKKALVLPVAFSVHLKKKNGFLIFNAWVNTVAVCKADMYQ